MEMNNKMGEFERKLIEEVEQGRELARRLQMCLHAPTTSQETRELLIHGIIAAFEKALAMANSSHTTLPLPIIPMSESPPLSAPPSPRSEDSDRDNNQDQNASRKRKSLPRWTKQIKVNPGMGVEGPLDDGFSWRKYGQKDILGAKHPRGYYRCTHRNVQGCLATKQVQRSDEDSTIFEITYRGNHTCTLASASTGIPPPPSTQERRLITNPNTTTDPHQPQSQDEDLLASLRAGLRVQTHNLDVPSPSPGPDQSLASLLFASTTSSTMNHIENPVFNSPMMKMEVEHSFAENFSTFDPSYVSPVTSGISYFSVSPGGVNFASSGSDINGMISAVTSAANSPTVALDNIPFDHYGFDAQNFTFDNPRFF